MVSSSPTVVGKPIPRLDGLEKVRGLARYTADIQMPGMLHAKVLRSPYAHARIIGIDTSKARALPGVHAVITAQDIPDLLVGMFQVDTPVLARDKVRFVGEEVAAVAAESAEVAEEALTLIDVEYEELPAVFNAIDAMKKGAPIVHEDRSRHEFGMGINPDPPAWRYNGKFLPVDEPSNIIAHTQWSKGDIEKGFGEADHIFEHTFTAQRVHQTYLEPKACLVWIDEQDIVQVRATTQGPFMMRKMLSDGIGVPLDRINFHPGLVGGDFGGKAGPKECPIAYFLASASGRPVKLVLNYVEELMAGHPRHPITTVLRIGVKKDGTLTACHAKAYQDCGAYGNRGMPLVSDAAGVYRTPNVRIDLWTMNTNTMANGAFRGVGQPQVIFALESHMEMIARELGLDPLAIRLRNVVQEGDTSSIGESWQHIRAEETLHKAAEAIEWGKKTGPLTGKGMAISEHHAIGSRHNVTVRLELDGSISVVTPVPDIGAGLHLVMRQLAAEVLTISPELTAIVLIGTTATTMDGGGGGGSHATHGAGNATLHAAQLLKAQLVTFAAEKLGCQEEELQLADGAFVYRNRVRTLAELAPEAPTEVRTAFADSFSGEPHITSFCSQAAEVAVDPETGQVQVLQLVSVHDVGTIINPMTHQGQIDGAVIQGLGFGVIEEMQMQEGRVISTTFAEHKIPSIKDVPPLKTVLLDPQPGEGPLNAQAIGEHPISGIAPAIANAIHDAVGVRITSLPITAEKVYRALQQSQNP